MIRLLQSYGFNPWYSGGTARDLYLKRDLPENIDVVKIISVDATLAELEKKLESRITDISSPAVCVQATYMNKTYRIYPLKKIGLVNTYLNIEFTKNKSEDMLTRDFTIHGGYTKDKIDFLQYGDTKKDLDAKLIRFVGDGNTRIMESKARLIRASGLLSRLGDGWKISEETSHIIKANAFRFRNIRSSEIYEEIVKVFIEAEIPSVFFYSLKNLGLLDEMFPELARCLYIDQTNKGVGLNLFQHIMFALDSIKKEDHDPKVLVKLRLAALLHDIGKPFTMTDGEKGLHFYQHELVGARIADEILTRWGFGRSFRSYLKHMIKNHLFDANPNRPLYSIKRLINRVGADKILELIELRRADRSGSHRDLSMKYLDKFKVRVNKILEKESPEHFKLMVADDKLNATGQTADITALKNHLRLMVTSGSITNKSKDLVEYTQRLNNTNCPFDWVHLFKTQEAEVNGDAAKFANGNLECGVYCDFACKAKGVTSLLKLEK